MTDILTPADVANNQSPPFYPLTGNPIAPTNPLRGVPGSTHSVPVGMGQVWLYLVTALEGIPHEVLAESRGRLYEVYYEAGPPQQDAPFNLVVEERQQRRRVSIPLTNVTPTTTLANCVIAVTAAYNVGRAVLSMPPF